MVRLFLAALLGAAIFVAQPVRAADDRRGPDDARQLEQDLARLKELKDLMYRLEARIKKAKEDAARNSPPKTPAGSPGWGYYGYMPPVPPLPPLPPLPPVPPLPPLPPMPPPPSFGQAHFAPPGFGVGGPPARKTDDTRELELEKRLERLQRELRELRQQQK